MMNKRVREGIRKIHRPNVRIKFCLGTIAIICACVMLLIIGTFTQIKIDFGMNQSYLAAYLKFEYIPQIPIVIFISALLGEFWGLTAVLIYIFMGLTPYFPIFALGGGLSYVFQYNFGYIFAYIFSIILVSKVLKNNPSILNVLFSACCGVFCIHAVGILYMAIIALIRHDSPDFISNWIYYQSLSKILYDIVFSFLAILTAKVCRRVLWLLIG